MSLPLRRYEGFRSYDVDQAREQMARVLSGHELKVLGRGARINARFHCRLPSIALVYVNYGVPVCVSPGVMSTNRLTVTTPDQPVSMWLSADNGGFVARLDWAAVVRQLAGMSGQDNVRLSFAFLGKLIRLVDREASLIMHPLLSAEIEKRLIAGLLLAQRNSCSRVLAQRGRPTPSLLVCHAVEAIEAAPRRVHTAGSLARQVGTSVLELESVFRRRRGMTVRDCVGNVRIKVVYFSLATGEPAATRVCEVTRRWGFGDPQAFDMQYASLFGESPHCALARRSLYER